MAIEPGGAFEVALYNNDFFTNSSNDDLQIRTMLERQRILIGTRSNADAAMMITSNTVMMNNNLFIYSKLGVGKSNLDTYPVDIIGNTAIDGSVNTTKHILCRGVQLRRKTGSYYSTSNLPSGLVQGFSNDNTDTDNGLTFYINSNTSTNYFRYLSAGNEIARFTGDGKLGIGISNPSYNLYVEGDAFINSNMYIAGHILPNEDVEYDLGTSNMRFRDLYLSSNTIHIGSSKIRSTTDGGIALLSENDAQAPIVSSMMSLSNYGKIILYTSNNNLGIALSNPTCILEIGGNDAILIPKGTTGQRPTLPKQGQIRYNTSINTFEGYGAGNTWGSLGGIKDTNQDTYISAESFPTSNDDILRFFNSNNETLRITAAGRIGISNQSPSERLEVSGGNAKFSSNIYSMSRVGIANSNPTEALDIVGNLKASSNIYSINRIGVATSNPTERLDLIGNAKISQNLFVLSNIGIGLSNPTTTLEVNGSIKVRSNIEILGDLTIRGNTTTVESTTVNIEDNIIRLNNGALFSSGLQAGFEINRGAGYCNYVVVFDESTNTLQTGFQGALKAVPNIDGSLVSNGVLLYDNLNKKITSCNNFVYSSVGLGIANSNPTESLDIIGNLKASSNIYSINRIGVANSNPTESLDIIGNLKASSNVYVLSKLGVGTSNPSTSVEINATDAILLPKGTSAQRPSAPSQGQIRYNTSINTFEGYGEGNTWGSLGGIKDTNQDTYISAESFPTSNDDILRFFNSNNETLRITAAGRIGISNQSPSERLEVSGGNAKFSSNIYVIGKIGVGSGSNPKESLDITGNILASQNIYSLGNIGIGTSNPMSRLEVNGLTRITSKLSVGSSNFKESLDITGNILASQNIYSLGNIGIGTSNPTSKLHVIGNSYIQGNVSTGHVVPLSNELYDLGRSNLRFRDLYLSSNTIYLGDGKIKKTAQGIALMDSNDRMTGNMASMMMLSNNGFIELHTLSNNLGIGTQTPSEKLEVNGSARISSNLEVANNLNVQGNLTVTGSTFVVNTDTVEVRDNIIVLNSGQVGSGVSAGTAGITIDRGDAVDYQILFNETTDKFEMGAAGSLIPIATEAYVNGRTYDASNIISGTLPIARGGTGTTSSTGSGNVVLSASPTLTGTVTLPVTTVNGDMTFGSGASLLGNNADSAITPSYSWNGDTNTGMFHASTDTIGFSTGGVNRLTINNSNINIAVNLTGQVASFTSLQGTAISSLTNSSASNVAASSAAVKSAYDLANTAKALAEGNNQSVEFNSKHDYMISSTTFTDWIFTNFINNTFISHDADVSTFVIKISGLYTFAANLQCWAHVDTHEFRILRTSTIGSSWNSKSSTIQYGMFPSITFFAYANDTINVQLKFPVGEGMVYGNSILLVYKH